MDLRLEQAYSLILKHISDSITLDGEEARNFLSSLQIDSYPKDSILLKPGEVCDTEIYILEGELGLEKILETGKSQVITRSGEKTWFNDRMSFIKQNGSEFYLKTMEHSTLALLPRENLNWLYKRVPKFERFFRLQMEQHYLNGAS